MTLLQAMELMTPEIVLTFGIFAILLLDGVSLRKRPVEHRHMLLGLTLGAFLLVVGAIDGLRLWQTYVSGEVRILCGGMYVESPLNLFFKGVVMVVAIGVVLMGLRTPFSTHVGEYYSLIAFSVLGMVFLISSEDLLMMFVSIELVSLPLYALTAFQKGVRRSIEGGLKYFLFGGLSAAFLLFGLSYLFGVTGTTSIREMSVMVESTEIAPTGMLMVGMLMVLVGLGFKIAAVPFQLWAPDAYEGAPTPVAALIATGSKVASFVFLTKLLFIGFSNYVGNVMGGIVFWQQGWTVPLGIMAALSMLVGNIGALAQKNVKRLLAYSSMAHAGYILVAFVAVHPDGRLPTHTLSSIYFYVVIYALTNIGAFGVVNVLASRLGGDRFEHFSGAAVRAPYLSLLLLIFLLSLAGIPPLAGFFGKFYLFMAAVQADPDRLGLFWLVVLAIAMSAVSLYYYLKLAKQMYVMPPERPGYLGYYPEAGTGFGLIAVVILLLGVFPSQSLEILQKFRLDTPSWITTEETPTLQNQEVRVMEGTEPVQDAL